MQTHICMSAQLRHLSTPAASITNNYPLAESQKKTKNATCTHKSFAPAVPRGLFPLVCGFLMRTVLPPSASLPSPWDSLTNGLLLWETCRYTVNKSDVNAFTKSTNACCSGFFGDKGITMATEAGWAVRRQAPPHNKIKKINKKISHTLPQTHKTLPHKQRLLNYFTTLL